MMLPALTMGDPAGIGPELTVKAWEQLRTQGEGFVWIGDPALIEGIPTQIVDEAEQAEAVFAHALPVLPVYLPGPVVPGQPDSAMAGQVIASIERATRLALEGRVSAVVTNPISKAVLKAAGFGFPGHTEFLASLCGVPGEEIMMLASPQLRVVPVTVHVSLREALDSLTTDKIVQVGKALARALRRDFGFEAPRIAVAGLNPHAGEGGVMGLEEQVMIEPAIRILRESGIDASGPYPPDTLFTDLARPLYDAALCMYHDQALIPLKTLDMASGVNVTLGLPIVRTSPDHGTAFAIAGKNRADPTSLLSALRLARDLGARRASGKEKRP
ncbi:4-hydroxythreonine-4-phosphate dehydrogenase PdxA [Asaia sp. As-1742]|uniref:4-hydroxythreonine-4-phosphate dehydrogenase PdxA n=1 Tax=Asaia sp. As-1742 TaxID=2608325 RepID=UPI0014203110|nr:4-hydroxythreonine-4-phosphate dehydrogenase PdxA [Asaia sp. As-1742]NIE80853.1 4-hydroxythreonine-4-phosphate dehydrogenase PdxA [Asaia sp. As-1742]